MRWLRLLTLGACLLAAASAPACAPPSLAAPAGLDSASAAPPAADASPAPDAPAAGPSIPAASAPRGRPGGALAHRYFYRPLPYGSDALVGPLRLIVNGGYGIMQVDSRANRPLDVDYEAGARNVWHNLSDPFSAIRRQGWSEFIRSEILPISTSRGRAQYWPNYTQHLIGGGMSFRLMAEWFDWHGFARPRLWSGATMVGYHFLNEVVENNGRHYWSTDPIADLYIFDPLGILLFSSDRVCGFFGQTLHMADWSYQPVYDPDRQTLENVGQNFALKWPLPFWKRWSLFYHWGTHAEMGLSRRWDGGGSLSFGAGLKAKDLVQVTDMSQTVDLAMSAGIFYDRNGSLLASVLYSRSQDYRLRFNVYPGLLPLGRLSPGLFLATGRDGRVMTGVTLLVLPLPVGYGASLQD